MLATIALLLSCVPSNAIAKQPLPVAVTSATDPIAAYVAEAAQRFGVPESWIYAVMRVESAGNRNAVSHAGAMGLMQVMPATWADLRARHGLGANPYDPRDNIMAGTAYLREMYDRFGSPGFLAAYNAGPGRYRDHLASGRTLPAETRHYLAKLAPIVGGDVSNTVTIAAVHPRAWTRAALFSQRSRYAATTEETGQDLAVNLLDARNFGPTVAPPKRASHGLFAPLSGETP